MILRRISVERYGCFSKSGFEFRRGMNLVSGGNESGKSLLLQALPAALLGVEHGSRLRSWGDSLSCRVTLLFEGSGGGVRLTRDLESNLVRLEESSADGVWQESCAGVLPPDGPPGARAEYRRHLERLLGVGDEAVLRALLNARDSRDVLTADGQLAGGLMSMTVHAATGAATEPVDPDEARSQQIARLEQEIEADRVEYRKGEEYLSWVRKRWQQQDGRAAPVKKAGSQNGASREAAALERQRDEMLVELKRQGLPARLPADLPSLFEQAEALRQELAALQLELTPLQRRRQGVVMPGFAWPLLMTVAGLAAPGATYLLKHPWLLPAAGAGAVILLLCWTIFLVRYNRARTERDALDTELHALEEKRADALARQQQLAERFEACGLPSAPVEMVKLQQLCRRHEELIRSYQELCATLGDGNPLPTEDGRETARDHHLRPEDLPDAERRLAELDASIRCREQQLAELRAGSAGTAIPAPMPLRNGWSADELLKAVHLQMERLTAGSCRGLRFEEGCLHLEVAPGRWAPPSSCSRGTVECLVLAIRLALAQFSGWPLLPVDELPASLDARRRQNVLRALERFAGGQQVVLASCDEELVRRAGREHWSIINLESRPDAQAPAGREVADDGQLHLL